MNRVPSDGYRPSKRDFLKRLSRIKQWKSGERRAPHKPLLLLYALGRIHQGSERFVSFRDVDEHVTDLLARFGRPGDRKRPQYPFTRLANDVGLWELSHRKGDFTTPSGEPSKPTLLKLDVRGGLPEDAYRLLLANPDLVQDAAEFILASHFPDTMHEAIRAAVGLDVVPAPLRGDAVKDAAMRPRDPNFRRNVLRAYRYRCAVCEYDVRLGNDLLGLEAAHVKWHAAGGPDEVPNGLALCGFHHKAFDRGAWGLAPLGRGYRVQISSDVNGLSDAVRWLSDYHNRRLQAPQRTDWRPDAAFVAWHTREVFRAPAA